MLLTSDLSGGIELWDTTTGENVRDFDGGYSGNDAVAFSPDGKTLAVGGANQNILLWDTESGKLLWSLLKVTDKADAEEFKTQ